MRNIHVINRYYPPNPAVTGEEAYRMTSHLRDVLSNTTVTVYHIDAPYPGGGLPIKPLGKSIGFRPVYTGRNKLLRFVGSFLEGYRLASNAVKKDALVISLTDPPLLNYWSGRFCKKRGVPWIYWAFDLYPEAFASAKLVGKKNLLYRHLCRSVRNNVPDFLVALGNEQAKFIRQRFAREVPFAVLPCGIHREGASEAKPGWRSENDKIFFVYAGNIGEAHSHDFLVDLIECLDVRRHRCILALYGAKSREVLDRVMGNPAVRCVSAIHRRDLFYIDVHIVSLSPEWTHICVPSKAVSGICAGGALLFNGLKTSDTWQMFGGAGWIIDEFGDRRRRLKAIKEALDSISDHASLEEKKNNSLLAKENLFGIESVAYDKIVKWIADSGGSVAGNRTPEMMIPRV